MSYQATLPGPVRAVVASFAPVERRAADRGGDPLLNLAVQHPPGLVPGLAAASVLVMTYGGGFLFTVALRLRAGLTFTPGALAFGVCWVFLAAAARPGPSSGRLAGLPSGGGRVPRGGARAALGGHPARRAYYTDRPANWWGHRR